MHGWDSDLRDDSSVPLHCAEHEKTNGVSETHEDDEKDESLKPECETKRLIYGVDDRPPFTIALICAFQVSPYLVSKYFERKPVKVWSHVTFFSLVHYYRRQSLALWQWWRCEKRTEWVMDPFSLPDSDNNKKNTFSKRAQLCSAAVLRVRAQYWELDWVS